MNIVFLKDKMGFNLIEMLIVLAIITTISVSLIANPNADRDRRAAKSSSQEILTVVRRAQGAALSGLLYNNQQTKAYRVHFVSDGNLGDNTVYQMCADVVLAPVGNDHCA